MMKQIEDIILQHSRRGMEKLRPYLAKDFCSDAAKAVLQWPLGNILLATGFYVKGFAETDGPVGTFVLAEALRRLGYCPVIVTDVHCRGYFEGKRFAVEYLPFDADADCAKSLLEKWQPVGMISIERCGRNIQGDYANMRGVSIRQNTAPVDLLFELAFGVVPTVGVGDGGNEIGMGNLHREIVRELSLVPCAIRTDHLVIATVSNWGAYGLAAALAQLTGGDLLVEPQEAAAFLEKTVAMGSVDGVTGINCAHVDGFPTEVELGILSELESFCSHSA